MVNKSQLELLEFRINLFQEHIDQLGEQIRQEVINLYLLLKKMKLLSDHTKKEFFRTFQNIMNEIEKLRYVSERSKRLGTNGIESYL